MMLFASTTVDLARAQFATTSIYYFLFVPLTLGLGPLLAIMQTAWHRTGNEQWLRLTRFFGTLFLITFAIGVATGLVQEFEIGMNWFAYSKFVGNVFGAPLAIEGLGAFFLESTFLGLGSSAGTGSRHASTSPRSGSPSPVAGSRRTSSSSPTHGCRSRSATRSSTARLSSRAPGTCLRTTSPSRPTATSCWRA
jgi:hypothetical protein